MPRVLLPEMTSHDLSSAQTYGDLEVATDERLSPLNPETISQILNAKFESMNFDPDQDFVCMSGNVVVLSVMVAVCANRYGIVPMLIFDARNSRYVTRILELSGKEQPHDN